MMSFKNKLKQGKQLIGALVTLGLPIVPEMLSRCGFDWLWIDMEHGPLELSQVQGMLQAKGAECAALVRVPENSEVWIKRVLDLGADGIIVPQVKTAEEARRAVAYCKYPPTGTRSVGIARAQGFGMDFAEYLVNANEELLVLLQIEHVDGVKNIDQILQVPDIDGIIVGPYDLSGSLGKLGQVQDQRVQEAMSTVRQACLTKKMPLGIFALQVEHGKAYLNQGYQLLALGIDFHYLWSAAKSSLEACRTS
jgi:2-keto-3-deoxy-L-rhamnonate aldolase RhmA